MQAHRMEPTQLSSPNVSSAWIEKPWMRRCGLTKQTWHSVSQNALTKDEHLKAEVSCPQVHSFHGPAAPLSTRGAVAEASRGEENHGDGPGLYPCGSRDFCPHVVLCSPFTFSGLVSLLIKPNHAYISSPELTCLNPTLGQAPTQSRPELVVPPRNRHLHSPGPGLSPLFVSCPPHYIYL